MKQFRTSEELVTKEKTPVFHPKANLKASWTYSKKELINGYVSSTKEAQNNMILTMNKVYDLLKENNIKMSLLIYPWPQQLKNKDLNSKHVEMWNKFCIDKCENFINLFPSFEKELKNSNFIDVYKKYFYWNDVHFNKKGNQLVANELLKVLN